MIARALILLSLLVGGASPALADRAESMHYVAAADAAFVQGQPRTARVELMNATEADPANAVAWMYRARVALALDEGHEAEEALDRAIAAGCASNRTLHFRAHALILENRPADALRVAAPDQVAVPYRGYAARMRGRALADLRDFPAAAREFGAAMATTPRNPAVWIDIARFRLLTGERFGAIEASDRALALDHQNVEALILKGQLVRDQYGLAAALSWFDKALKIDRLNIDAQIERAATLGDMGRMRDMLAMTRSVQALQAFNPRAFYLQAVLAARAHNFTLADKLIDQTNGALDDVAGMMLLKGMIAYQRGIFGEAIVALARLVQAQPDNSDARRLLAAAQWRTGDAEAVIATLAPVADDSDADNYVLTLFGRAYEAEGDRVTAAVYLDRAARYSAPGNSEAPDAVAIEKLRWNAQASREAAPKVALINALMSSGDAGQALDLAVELERDNPGAPEAHMLAGDVWRRIGRLPQALEAYRRAANLRFSDAVALRMVATLGRAGRVADAARVLDLFLDQNPMNVPARMLQSDLLMAGGRFVDAAAILAGLRQRLGTHDIAIASNLAWCYFRTDRIDQALQIAARAYRLAPANPRLSHSYGWILYKSGRNPRGALALLQQAAAQAPDWDLARIHLAEAEMVHGRTPIG